MGIKDDKEDRSIRYNCKNCGGKHGGSMSRDYCEWCYKKLFGKK